MAINIRQRFTLDTQSNIASLIEGDSLDFIRAFIPKTIGLRHEFNGFIHSGLGTSASAAVAMVAGFNVIVGKKIDKFNTAEEAWKIEAKELGMFGGKQDQYISSFGGVKRWIFEKDISFEPVVAPENILLFDTGIKRTQKDIQHGLKELTSKKIKALHKLKQLAIDYEQKDTGDLLDTAWYYKKESNKVSTPEIDELYDRGKKLGATGGKLCGSGGGGYMIFCVPEEKQSYFKENIGLKWVDYSIDYQGVDTRIL